MRKTAWGVVIVGGLVVMLALDSERDSPRQEEMTVPTQLAWGTLDWQAIEQEARDLQQKSERQLRFHHAIQRLCREVLDQQLSLAEASNELCRLAEQENQVFLRALACSYPALAARDRVCCTLLKHLESYGQAGMLTPEEEDLLSCLWEQYREVLHPLRTRLAH